MTLHPAPPRRPVTRSDRHWAPASPHPPEGMGRALHGWLTEPGSLTERLARHWPDLAVQLLHEGEGAPSPDEAQRLSLPAGATAWLRAVQLVGGGAVRLQARSVVPHWRAGHHPWAAVAALGTQPLGRLLFGAPEVQRSGHEWACTAAGDGTLRWSRRCVYIRAGLPLLLTETFVSVPDAG